MKKVTVLVSVLFMAFSCSWNNGTSTPPPAGEKAVFSLSSPDFRNNSSIPREFTCDGVGMSPALFWSNAPSGTGSFILTVTDPDAPSGNFRHWIVVNIPKSLNYIPRNSTFPPPASVLQNDFGKNAWGGPCPPSGTHRYVFTLYAVDSENYNSQAFALEEFLDKHAISSAVLTGLYKRGMF